ncbi:hypothetical protein [Paenibacillus sp. Root444D2]|uniref:hypothetical protein n=1 Tax=Paenibacillus sp. Root444D2 TaxID=1736538 RepID=UPI0012E3538A|nr:hypothetical protein [Paenibacillus sp. Root444D2]
MKVIAILVYESVENQHPAPPAALLLVQKEVTETSKKKPSIPKGLKAFSLF